MADRSVRFVQIYYKETQRGNIYPFAYPYFNESLTPFFENSIIAALVPESKADVTAICSWALRSKMTANLPPRRELTLELLESDYDVLALTKNSPSHDTIAFMEAHHAGSSDLLREIWAQVGLSMPRKAKNPIYQNAFSARTEIYQQYVRELLAPAMEVMEKDPKIHARCWADSRYRVSTIGIPVDFDRIERLLGVGYVPMHTFMLERCFSLWIEGKNLNVVTI